MIKLMRSIFVGLFLLGTGTAQAALVDRGGGLIYDTVLNVTWLQDANYAKTSGYDADGLMDWTAANIWAANLNYGGYSDWRLPTTRQPDPSCRTNGSPSLENCRGSELGSLFFIALGNAGVGSGDPNIGLVNSGPFQNMEAGHGYWSETSYASNNAYAWYFHFASGYQAYSDNLNLHLAIAVRNGDVEPLAAPIPEPSTCALLSLALAGLGATRRTKHTRNDGRSSRASHVAMGQ